MAKVKCVKEYKDKVLNKIIKIDDVLDVTEARAKELVTAKVAVITEEKAVKKRASKKEE